MGTESQIPANELAELYDAFEQLHTLLQRILSADSIKQSTIETAPMEQYKKTIKARNRGGGSDDADSYGHQQYARNPFPMAVYRERYGNGDRVQNFNVIETEPLTDNEQSELNRAGLINDGETFQLPVAPQSGERLPLIISSDEAADKAIKYLDEFPARPTALSSTAISSNMNLRPLSTIHSSQRSSEIVVYIEAVQTDPGSKRDAELIVGDVDGATVSFDLWTTHSIEEEFNQGEWYWLHEPRCKAWQKNGETRRRLSSTKDLVIESLGEEVVERDIEQLRDEYDVNPPSVEEVENQSEDGLPVDSRSDSSAPATQKSSTASKGDSDPSETVSSLMDDMDFTDSS